MIRIKELFRLQHLRYLRLIAGQEGIGRTVTAAVLLEYDATRMQLPDFYRGDLVVTTLAYARGDNQLVANSLLALMNQGIACLLVKTAYFSELPQSVVSMANKLGTPLFLFDDTYIEEVILEVTELIRGKRRFAGFEKELDALMRGGMTPEQTRNTVQKIDPVGSRAYRLYAIMPQDRPTALDDKLYHLFAEEMDLVQRYTCMEWRRMLIALRRMDEKDETDGKLELEQLMERAGVERDGYFAGASGVRTEQAAFGMALNEAVYAARAAKLTGKNVLCAQELGMYAYLFPMSENPFVCDQCRRSISTIREYDRQNRANLEQTARVYVSEKMEISAAAKALYQHPNTVRYRLTKIQKLMGMDDDALFGPMLSLMVNLSRILEDEENA